jgi:hypothetical protein
MRIKFMSKKITIITPDDIVNKIELIKKDLDLKSISETFCIGAELLYWMQIKYNEGYKFYAEKQLGNSSLISEFPIEKYQDKK